MGSIEWEQATTPNDFAGDDAMVDAFDDGCFGTVIGGSPVGIRSTMGMGEGVRLNS